VELRRLSSVELCAQASAKRETGRDRGDRGEREGETEAGSEIPRVGDSETESETETGTERLRD
jgi:hypothetical protein